MPFLRGNFFWKIRNYEYMGIQFQQSGNVHGIVGIHFETRRNFNHQMYELETMR